ncbi:MAG: glucosaminidase domain-containing protein [Tannerella sp.]|jgi:LysM repeat protein|nr:glucosaminidase domain-containing protein [Tannerella sp.]
MKLNSRYILLFLLFIAFNSFHANAIRKNSTYEKYIGKYRDEAVRQQKKYKIPASITLAQALLESNAGASTLAKNSNNHFGIKCHSNWKGARSYHNDDRANECFRKYKSVLESYEDHSRFLVDQSRYDRLFNYRITDYRRWAKGLQECGYATDRGYANKLIDIIETYQLYNIDREKTKKEKKEKRPANVPLAREVFKTHDLIYVIADNSDTLDDIASDLGFKAGKLRKYNEMPEGFPLEKGDVVYLQKKKKKADKPYQFHTVRIGESMHGISQRYGIQIKSLYKLNNKKPDFTPEEGDVLKLR